MKTVTFYSGKLWHSDKPFPKGCSYESKVACGSAECLNDGCGFIRSWLSTAYEVVNPEAALVFNESPDRDITDRIMYFGNGEEWGTELKDGDQITLPDGYGIETAARHKWKEGTGMEFVRLVATITLPEKPDNKDKIYIDGDFNGSYESRVRRARGKKIEGLGNEKFDVHEVDSQNVEFVEKVDSVQWQDIMTTAAGVDPSESQEEMWAEFEKEFVQKSIIRMGIKQIIAELSQKFTITRK